MWRDIPECGDKIGVPSDALDILPTVVLYAWKKKKT